jgi:hypothetical protein
LVLDIFPISAPVRLELKAGIEHGGGIARIELVVGTTRLRQAISPIESWLVASRTTHSAIHRNAGIEIELAA